MSSVTRASVVNGVVMLSPDWQTQLQQVREYEALIAVPTSDEVWDTRDNEAYEDELYMTYWYDDDNEDYAAWLIS